MRVQGHHPTLLVLDDIATERDRQEGKFPGQVLPDGTGQGFDRARADHARTLCDEAAENGTLTWRHVLREEVAEAFAEKDPALLRAELVQVAAVAARWVEQIDREARS